MRISPLSPERSAAGESLARASGRTRSPALARRWRTCALLALACAAPGCQRSAPEAVATEFGIQIEGGDAFRAQVRDSLSLIDRHAPRELGEIARHVKRIKHDTRSGMAAYENPPTFYLADRSAFYSVTWCAGCIAHDAHHSKLYHDYLAAHGGQSVPDAVWSGQAAEQQCLKYQLTILESIGAPDDERVYVASCDGSHGDVNRDGKYDWRDDQQRNW